MRPSGPDSARLTAALLYSVNVLQPAREMDVLRAAERLVSRAGVSATQEDMRAAFSQLRDERLIWRVGEGIFSLTALGHDFLRGLGLGRLRDKARLLRLRKLVSRR
jgi:hypothetical protein